jgi:hypothetical protein
VLDVADTGHAVHKGGEIRGAARGVKFAAAMEFFGEGDEIDGLLGFAERDHAGEDVAVLGDEEIVGLERFDGGVESVVVEEDGAEDGTLRVEIGGQWAFENGISGHRDSYTFHYMFAFSSLYVT